MRTWWLYLLICTTTAGSAQGASLYSVTDLGSPAGEDAYAYSINNSGAIVGWERSSSLDMAATALLWQPGQPTLAIGAASGNESSFAMKINDAGVVLGTLGTAAASGFQQPFLWNSLTGLQNVGDPTLTLNTISNSGRGVGYLMPPGASQTSPVIYDPVHGIQPFNIAESDMTRAVSINDNDQILVITHTTAGSAGSIYQPDGSMIPITGVTQNEMNLTGFNDHDIAIGYQLAPSGDWDHAFLWNASAGMRDLTPGSGIASTPAAINNLGQVIGWEYRSNDMHTFPFIYEDGQVYDMNSLLDASGAGWGDLWLYGINDKGEIVGAAIGSDGLFHAVLLSPVTSGQSAAVPEPSSLAVLGVGAGLLLVRRRRVGDCRKEAA